MSAFDITGLVILILGLGYGFLFGLVAGMGLERFSTKQAKRLEDWLMRVLRGRSE